jgi:hypothetical protein
MKSKGEADKYDNKKERGRAKKRKRAYHTSSRLQFKGWANVVLEIGEANSAGR